MDEPIYGIDPAQAKPCGYRSVREIEFLSALIPETKPPIPGPDPQFLHQFAPFPSILYKSPIKSPIYAKGGAR